MARIAPCLRRSHGSLNLNPAPRVIRADAAYCGSGVVLGDAYRDVAACLVATLARRGGGIVYCGTHKGLMGVLADAAPSVQALVHQTGRQ